MSMKVVTNLRTGLKVGPGVLRAMGEGKHSLLLQRVSDKDFQGHFPLRDLEFFLLPGEDDKESGVRPEFHSLLSGPSDRDGAKVTVRYKAQAVDVAMIMDGSDLKAFTSWHIWTEESFQARLEWDATDPMFLLLCKVVRLDPPLEIPWKDAYDGEDPWIRLDEDELAPVAFVPVLEHVDFLKIVVDVKNALAEVQKNPVERPEPEKPAAAAKPAPPPPPKPAPPAPPKPGGEGKDAPAG